MSIITLNLNNEKEIIEQNQNDEPEQLLNGVMGIEQTASEEVNNIVNTNPSFLSDLQNTGAKKAYTKLVSTISTIGEIEHNILSLPFYISNINWGQFCERNNFFDIVRPRENQLLVENQIVIKDTITHKDKDKARDIIVNNDTLIPYIEDADITKTRTTTRRQANNSGMFIIQQKGNVGIVCYTTFIKNKKIFSAYIVPEGSDVKQFYYITSVKSNLIIPNISIPNSTSLRPLTDELTETDIINIANSSARLKKKAKNFTTVGDALTFFDDMLKNTVDFSYITKLITLNRDISISH